MSSYSGPGGTTTLWQDLEDADHGTHDQGGEIALSVTKGNIREVEETSLELHISLSIYIYTVFIFLYISIIS